MILRIVQIAVGLLIVPMTCLGIMASMSGGGTIPAFQQVGGRLMSLSPIVGALSVLASFALQRIKQTGLAYAILIVPILVWVYLIVELQRKTGFFS